jgi:serine/threonine protein phosphatase PrpC
MDSNHCNNIEADTIKVTNETEIKNNDDDSDVQVGDIGEDRLDNKGVEEDDSETVDISSQGPSSLLEKLLAIRQGVKVESTKNNIASDANSDSALLEVEMEFKATKTLNGRQVCNLPDHPIHAGCTAVCAVITDSILTVANAGDSRVVLCRGDGVTEAMSFDHKPIHDVEMNRITEAGGFVNTFGRVNGNLNLSRSIGDLKYKQVPNIGPSAQMITAEPDIKQVTLNSDDEFIILACDGIWDCLTNEEAVKYVLDRIDTQSPIEIGIEMLDSIISIDPRVTQGIGGDNMTVMIVDLKPETRSWRKTEQQN